MREQVIAAFFHFFPNASFEQSAKKATMFMFMLRCKAYQLSCNFMRHDVFSGFCWPTLSACAVNYMIFVNFIFVRMTICTEANGYKFFLLQIVLEVLIFPSDI